MLHNTNTPIGVAVTSSPGIAYTIASYMLDIPIEKWASGLACVFVTLQISFLLIDRFRKKRDEK